jgi:hypothetical protein
MDKRKGYVLLLINAGVRSSVMDEEDNWREVFLLSEREC